MAIALNLATLCLQLNLGKIPKQLKKNIKTNKQKDKLKHKIGCL